MRPQILGKPWVRSYKQMASDLRLIQEWCASLGIDISPTRIKAYVQTIADLGRIGLRPGANLNQVLPTLFEVRELFEIWEGFKDHPPCKILVDKMSLVVGGTTNLREELSAKSKNVARNTAFELACAGDARRRGLDVTLRSDVDFAFLFEGRPIYVECKRIFSLPMAPKRVTEGFKQLNRVADNSSPNTMLMLDFSRALNPDFFIPSFDTHLDVAHFGRKLLYDAFAWLKPIWSREAHKRHLGLSARCSTLAFIRSTLDLFRTDEWATLTFERPAGTLDTYAEAVFARLMHPQAFKEESKLKPSCGNDGSDFVN